jgi:hypothetical protein
MTNFLVRRPGDKRITRGRRKKEAFESSWPK